MTGEGWAPATDFGRRALGLLESEKLIWLTTVDPSGRPQPNPVWFVWDGETVLVYSHRTAVRNRNLASNSRVALHFNSDTWGEKVVIISGEARLASGEPPVSECRPYTEKYEAAIPSLGLDVARYAELYSVPIRITPQRVRGF